MEDSSYLSIAEVAKMLRVNPSTVRRWINTGAMETKLMSQSTKNKRMVCRVHEDIVKKILGG